jgi:hypothetical protein
MTGTLSMNAHVIFNTLEYMTELKNGGISQKEAEAITKATEKAFHQLLDNRQLATKNDIIILKISLQTYMIKLATTMVSILGGIQLLFHLLQ